MNRNGLFANLLYQCFHGCLFANTAFVILALKVNLVSCFRLPNDQNEHRRYA